MVEASVIISFYNKSDYLKLVLAGFEIQSKNNFEIIIADDGSEEKIVQEIETLSNQFPFRIKHIWQEDKGFRKNRILNQAILASESDYLIFIDGDCIPHQKFVEGHLQYKSKKTALTGRRVNLSQKITDSLTPQKIKEQFLQKKVLLLIEDGLFGKSYDVEKGLYFKSNFLRNLFNKKSRGLLGCNFSLYKEDIFSINGFDERYEAPSIGEDSDVQYRLELYGVKIKSLNHIAVQYHLYHKLQERPQKNLILFENVKKNKTFFTPHGIQKH